GTVAHGRETVEKTLQREGKTAIKLEGLAARAGFRSTHALFEAVGKDEYSMRNLQHLLRPPEPARSTDEVVTQRHPRPGSSAPTGGVLVAGVESLLTSLARCCRPAPPDAIRGYVTRGRGVSIHRSDCGNLRQMARRAPERVIAVDWGAATTAGEFAHLYPVEVLIEATDRPGLLREISEVFAKDKLIVSSVDARALKTSRSGSGWVSVTVEVADVGQLADVLVRLVHVAGVHRARRR
ncbi:MAG: GTP pyrophosphokinase, partial [Burkholderiaceae bacterium]|nr:GTP pyrophosphokinase [Burkholderiaceae bacterium]